MKKALYPAQKPLFMLLRIVIYVLARIGDGAIFIFIWPMRNIGLWKSKIFQFIKDFFRFYSRKSVGFSVHIVRVAQFLGNITQNIFTGLRDFILKIKTVLSSLVRPRLLKFNLPRFKLQIAPPRFLQFFLGLVLGVFVTVFFVLVPYSLYLYLKFLPNPRLLSQRSITVTTKIFDRNQNLLYEIYDDENREPLPLQQIPQFVRQATIAIEDKEFYRHPGFSLAGIARATKETFVNHHTQGGSTLTQQLIKNSLLTSEVTLQRKIREIILAFWAERIYNKNQILEMYLNQVPYGGIYWGIESAAQGYFGKSVTDLTLAEAAYLAGLPAAPTLYSPYGTRPDLARQRQLEVLRRMREDGYIDSLTEEKAQQQVINIKPQLNNIKAAHFVMYVREILTQKYGSRLVNRGGLRITTTLDLPLQEKTQSIVSANIQELARLKVGNGAAVVTNPKNGDILAMVGSKDYFDTTADGNVNVALALRQPGSSIKVVNYAAALEKGFTAASVIEDTPVAFTGAGTTTYAPVNYDGRFHGRVTLRQALGNSYNIPAVKVLNRIGIPAMLDMGKRMGIDSWNDPSRYGLSLTLGGGEVTLLDMLEVYGTLANTGIRTEPNPILKITDYTGKVLYERQASPVSAVSPEIAFIISDILSDNQARSAAFGINSALNIPGRTVAVKTGTTNDKRDNWTIGYTPNYAVGVWVGNNNNSPMDPYLTSGITGAAPIWRQIMELILQNQPDEKFFRPESIVSLNCNGKTEVFIKDSQNRDCTVSPPPSPAPAT